MIRCLENCKKKWRQLLISLLYIYVLFKEGSEWWRHTSTSMMKSVSDWWSLHHLLYILLNRYRPRTVFLIFYFHHKFFILAIYEQMTGYHTRDPGFDSRSRNTRVNPGSFQLNITKQPRTTIINKLECSQGRVYPRYTSKSQYTIMIRKCQYNQHTYYSQQYWGVVTS